MSAIADRPLELWLPALARFEASHPLRQWLRRGDPQPAGVTGYIPGLDGYFQCDAQPLPAAALTRELLAGDAGDSVWLSADPAWVQPDLNGVRLLACGEMQLSLADVKALADTLIPVFREAGMMLETTTPDRWHLRLAPGSKLPAFVTPEQALGEDLLQHLPQGSEGRRWRLLLNEIQVLLHQHPLNRERATRGLAPVNSVWLWGGGVLPPRVRSTLVGVLGDDPLLLALAARAGIEAHACTHESAAVARPGWLIDLHDITENELTMHWWPVIESLARQQSLTVNFLSGERWRIRPWHRWRVWRGAAA